MSYFDLDPAGAESAWQNAALNPITPGDMGPGFWSGTGAGTIKGLVQGVIAQPALLLGDAVTPALTPVARSIDEMFGGSSVEDWLKNEQRKTVQAVRSLMPGPETGTAGQIMYGASSVIPQAIAGTVYGGPAGGAALPGALQGYASKRMGDIEGLDEVTATARGAIDGMVMAAGVALPGSIGARAGVSAVFGAGSNVILGVGQRAATSELLRARGYGELAKQYEAFDGTQIAIDAILGGAFGVLGARMEAGRTVPPALTDAALAANKQNHLEVSTAPGVPADPTSRTLHNKAIEKAISDLAGDGEVNVAATGVDAAAFVPNRAVLQAGVEAALREEGSLRSTLDAVDELRREVEARGLAPADEALFEGRKLQDGADVLDASGARDLPGATVGRAGEVFVGDRAQPVRFVVVEADALAATIGKADNQFRDRTRAASQQQIAKIAGDLQFGRLGEAPTMAEGAPTLAQDGQIVGGNGRVAAVQQAYERGLGEAYRVALEQRAAEFGLSADQVQGYARPVLVRQLTAPVDVKLAAILSNEGGALRMSALEQAKVDAERMPDLRAVELPESGDFKAASLREFVNQWLARYPQNELGEFVSADGKLSPQGEHRLQNAILYKAYGDSPTLERLVEATDDLSKNMTGALVKAAQNVADARALIEAGELYDLDIQPMLLQAVDTTQMLRAEGVKLETWLDQNDMFGTGVGPETVLLMDHFRANARSQRAMVEAITGYYDAVRAYGNPRQASMFDLQPPARGEILRAVLEKRDTDPLSLRQYDRATAPEMTRLKAGERKVLLGLYEKAEGAKPAFDQEIAALAEEFGGTARLAPLKGISRAVDKIAADYAGTASHIGDLLRATIEVDSVAAAQQVAKRLGADFEVSGTPRNLFAPDARTIDGYRDAKFNVLVDGVKAEIQVNLPEMLVAKKAVHDLYEQRSRIERDAYGREMTAEESATVADLNQRMRAVYDPAFAAASAREASTSAAKSSGDTGAPLRRADSAGKGRGGSTSQAAQDKPTPASPIETGTPSTSNNSALARDFSSISTSESIVSPLAESATVSEASRQVLDDMPNAQVLDLVGDPMPAGLALEQSDAKIAMSESDSAAYPAAAACALKG